LATFNYNNNNLPVLQKSLSKFTIVSIFSKASSTGLFGINSQICLIAYDFNIGSKCFLN
jgi:hypothetical protein